MLDPTELVVLWLLPEEERKVKSILIRSICFDSDYLVTKRDRLWISPDSIFDDIVVAVVPCFINYFESICVPHSDAFYLVCSSFLDGDFADAKLGINLDRIQFVPRIE